MRFCEGCHGCVEPCGREEGDETKARKYTEEVKVKKAKRFNDGKPDLSLLPAKACIEESKVWKMGEGKYGRDNWKQLWGEDTVNVAMASLLRHAFAILEGEYRDAESNEYHAAHIRCNAAMVIEYLERVKK